MNLDNVKDLVDEMLDDLNIANHRYMALYRGRYYQYLEVRDKVADMIEGQYEFLGRRLEVATKALEKISVNTTGPAMIYAADALFQIQDARPHDDCLPAPKPVKKQEVRILDL